MGTIFWLSHPRRWTERSHQLLLSLLAKYIKIITNENNPQRVKEAVQCNNSRAFLRKLWWVCFQWLVKTLLVYDGMKGSLIFQSIFTRLCDNLIRGPVQGIMMTDNAVNLKTDTIIFITCKLSEPCNLHNQLSIQFSNFIFIVAFWSCAMNK